LLWLCANCCASAPQGRGIFYGNPTSGSIRFAELSSQTQGTFAQTFVSHPTAVVHHTDRVYFGNIEPLSKRPWISSAPISGNERATPFSSSKTTNVGVYIGDMAIDSDYQSGSLFFLYRDMDQSGNRASKDHLPLGVIFTQPLDSAPDSPPTVVFSMKNGTVPPNSIALDTANKVIYFSSNGLFDSTKDKRSNGGIYKVAYTGGDAELVLPLSKLAQTNSFIASLKFYNNYLYYIVNTANDQTIRKVDVNDLTSAEVICDHLSFTPMEIELDVNNDQLALWIRDTQGAFYRASETNCANPAVLFTVPHVLDFVFDSDSKNFFSVNSDVAAVLSYNTNSKASAIVSGIGEDTNIWVDGANQVLYYSTYNRIDSFTIEENPKWSMEWVLDERVEGLTGDEVTGNLIVAKTNTTVSWNPRAEQEPTILLPFLATSMTVWNSTLYYVTNDSNTYSLKSCHLNNCNSTAKLEANASESIHTVSVAADGSIFYGTTDGLFQASNSTVVVPYLATISPYAITLRAKQLTYIDMSGNDIIIGTCEISNCSLTLRTTTVHFNPTTRVEPYAFIESDPHGMVYWTASLSPGTVYRFDSTNSTADVAHAWNTLPGGRVRGMTLDGPGDYLYVSVNTDAWRYPTDSVSTGRICVTGENVTVSALEVGGSSLYWSDARTGSVFQCQADCDHCWDSTPVNTGSVACSSWQTLSVQKKVLYEQQGCGGVARVLVNSTQQTQTLRSAGQYPFADLITVNSNTLAFAVPFRATISQSTVGRVKLTSNSTVLTGTGLFTNLVVDQSTGSNTYYWNDPASRKLLMSTGGSVSDLTLEFALALSSYVPTDFPSSSPSPTGSLLPSPSRSASVSMSASASASASAIASASASVSVTSTATMSISMTPTTSTTPSFGSSRSPSASVSGSASTSVTMTPSSSVNPTISTNETSPNMSPTTSPSLSPTASLSPSFGTPTHTFLFFLNNSASNTPGLANMTEPVVSPLISTTGWEWISLISLFLIVCVILPCSYCAWKNTVEQEMSMSLRLP